MTGRVLRIRPRAIIDIEDESLYLGREAGPNTAIRFERAVANTLAGLLRFPNAGARRIFDGAVPGSFRFVRVDGFPKMLVFYRVTRTGVWVVRVLHGARDITIEDLE